MSTRVRRFTDWVRDMGPTDHRAYYYRAIRQVHAGHLVYPPWHPRAGEHVQAWQDGPRGAIWVQETVAPAEELDAGELVRAIVEQGALGELARALEAAGWVFARRPSQEWVLTDSDDRTR